MKNYTLLIICAQSQTAPELVDVSNFEGTSNWWTSDIAASDFIVAAQDPEYRSPSLSDQMHYDAIQDAVTEACYIVGTNYSGQNQSKPCGFRNKELIEKIKMGEDMSDYFEKLATKLHEENIQSSNVQDRLKEMFNNFSKTSPRRNRPRKEHSFAQANSDQPVVKPPQTEASKWNFSTLQAQVKNPKDASWTYFSAGDPKVQAAELTQAPKTIQAPQLSAIVGQVAQQQPLLKQPDQAKDSLKPAQTIITARMPFTQSDTPQDQSKLDSDAQTLIENFEQIQDSLKGYHNQLIVQTKELNRIASEQRQTQQRLKELTDLINNSDINCSTTAQEFQDFQAGYDGEVNKFYNIIQNK